MKTRLRILLSAWFLALGLLSGVSHAQAPPKNNLIYEIFVRSFADGDNDAKHIGDLKGVVGKLDSYLNDGDATTDHDLEAGILWLMPVFPSPSYHGYDVTDYRAINPDHGTLDDFKTLIKESHQRGVRVMLDIPFNHTSNRHPWFKEAIDNASSPRRKFYQIRTGTINGGGWHPVTNSSGEKLSYFGLFSDQMPDLDFQNADVRQEVKNIAKFWIDLGVDGFRLDAAKHIFGDTFDRPTEDEILHNNDWWREFSFSVYGVKPDAVIVGEVLGDPELLRRHSWGLDGLLDEPFMNDLRDEVGWPKQGFLGRQKQFLDQTRAVNKTAYQPPLPFPDQPFEPYYFVGSHDRNPRLASDLEDMQRRGMTHSVDEAARLAAYTLLTIGDYPIIYAGDELLQRGWKWNGNSRNEPRNAGDGSGIFDETLREPFPWFQSGDGPGQTKWFTPRFDQPNDGVSQEEANHAGTVFDVMRGISNLRTKHPSFANGDLAAIASDTGDWMVFERTTDPERYLVLINTTANGNTYQFHEHWYAQYIGAQLLFWSDGKLKKWKDTTGDNTKIDRSVFVPPFGMVVLRKSN